MKELSGSSKTLMGSKQRILECCDGINQILKEGSEVRKASISREGLLVCSSSLRPSSHLPLDF